MAWHARRVALSGAVLLGLGGICVLSDGIVYLSSEGPAAWIETGGPMALGVHAPGGVSAGFRKVFALRSRTDAGEIRFKALGSAWIRLDGHELCSSGPGRARSRAQRCALPPLDPGRHEIEAAVRNRDGPAVLALRATVPGLATGSDWLASRDGRLWAPAGLCAESHSTPLSLLFPSAGEAFLGGLFLFVPLFFLFFLWSSAHLSGEPPWIRRWTPGPGALRAGLWGAWLFLAANNILKLPVHVGYDAQAHMEYIRYVAERWSLPLASEGWQMFQAPLYYMVSAPLYAAASLWSRPDALLRLMRVIPLLCGAAQIECAWRAVRVLYPGRAELQAVGMVFGAFLPMNLYMSQAPGNEPLAGLLSAAVVLLALTMAGHPEGVRQPGWACASLGLLWGLALLAKSTAILLALPLAIFLGSSLRGMRRAGIARAFALLFGAPAVAAGGYYLRNYAEFGAFFIGGWDPARGIVWWQEPGYRTWRHLASFGEALRRPVYSGLAGFWDAAYSTLWSDGCLSGAISFHSRPPWNYGWMIAGAWWAVTPTALIGLGAASACRMEPGPRRGGLLFALSCLATYWAAMFLLYLRVPHYSAVKASYTIGLLPCYALLLCAGLDRCPGRTYARAALHAALACWAVSAYAAYFVL